MALGLGDKHPITVLLGAHLLEHPSTTCSIQGRSLALCRDRHHRVLGLALHVTASLGARGITQGSVGHSRTCHHLPRSLGKSPSALSCHGAAQTFQPGHQRGKLWDPALSFSSIQAPFPGLSGADPVLPHPHPCWCVPGPCPARGAPAQPAPGDLHGFEACQEFYPSIWLPFSYECALLLAL